MIKITPNFNFNGKCKEALQLYKEAFNAEIISLIPQTSHTIWCAEP